MTSIVVLTGAGISAESGLATFRNAGGLWERYRFQDLASPQAWAQDPSLVWRFYSMRRQAAAEATPNAAHHALASWEKSAGDTFLLCTQNVDDLHERAGSQRVLHIHGELTKTRCESCARPPFIDPSLYPSGPPTCDNCGAKLRPHIVWFGESPFGLERVQNAVARCQLFVTIGSSGTVYPAAGLVQIMQARQRLGEPIRSVYIGLESPANDHAFDEIILGPATAVVPEFVARQDIPINAN